MLADRIVLFGDTVRAQVEVSFDRRQIDPAAIKVRAGFDAWRHVVAPRVTRVDAGSSSLLRVSYVLRCLRQPCVPERDTIPFEFDPAGSSSSTVRAGEGR